MTVIINLYVESQYFKMYLATKKHLKVHIPEHTRSEIWRRSQRLREA